jgi:hypothetical protein
MWSGSFSHRIQNAKLRGATALTPNQALEQTRDSVLRYGEPVGRELLNIVVRQQEAQSQSQSRCGAKLMVVADARQREW